MFDPTRTSKNSYKPMCFMFFIFLAISLKDAFGDEFGRQNASKIDPKSVQNPIKNEAKISCNLDLHFLSLLNPTWRQLGPNLKPSWGPKSLKNRSWGGQKSVLRSKLQKLPPKAPKMTKNDSQTVKIYRCCFDPSLNCKICFSPARELHFWAA